MGAMGRLPTSHSANMGDATQGHFVYYEWGCAKRLWIVYDDGPVRISDDSPGNRRTIAEGAYAVLYVVSKERPE